jgi:hypothetical protein
MLLDVLAACSGRMALHVLAQFAQCSSTCSAAFDAAATARLAWVRSLNKTHEQKLAARLLECTATIDPRFALGTEGHASLISKWRNAPLLFLKKLDEYWAIPLASLFEQLHVDGKLPLLLVALGRLKISQAKTLLKAKMSSSSPQTLFALLCSPGGYSSCVFGGGADPPLVSAHFDLESFFKSEDLRCDSSLATSYFALVGQGHCRGKFFGSGEGRFLFHLKTFVLAFAVLSDHSPREYVRYIPEALQQDPMVLQAMERARDRLGILSTAEELLELRRRLADCATGAAGDAMPDVVYRLHNGTWYGIKQVARIRTSNHETPDGRIVTAIARPLTCPICIHPLPIIHPLHSAGGEGASAAAPLFSPFSFREMPCCRTKLCVPCYEELCENRMAPEVRSTAVLCACCNGGGRLSACIDSLWSGTREAVHLEISAIQ